MTSYNTALVRPVSRAYQECFLEFGVPEQIDISLADQQHEIYCQALERCGLSLHRLPEMAALPDACFVEDSAVIVGDVALVTWMGTTVRNGEQAGVEPALSRWFEIVKMVPPACLEGGDVLRIGKTMFVGLSRCTNAEGIDVLRALADRQGIRVVPVPIKKALHLKTAATYVGDGTLLAAAWLVPELARLTDSSMRIVGLDGPLDYAANVLRIGDHLLVPGGYGESIAGLTGFKGDLIEVPMSEFRKGEAGLTCLSIIF